MSAPRDQASPEAARAERAGKTPTLLVQEPPTLFPTAREWGAHGCCPDKQGLGCTCLTRSVWGGAAQVLGNASLAVQGIGTHRGSFQLNLERSADGVME